MSIFATLSCENVVKEPDGENWVKIERGEEAAFTFNHICWHKLIWKKSPTPKRVQS